MNNFLKALLPEPAMQNLHDPSGIGYADTLDPSVPLLVRVGPYTDMAAGHIIDLYCDGTLVFNYTIKDGDIIPETPSYVVLELDQQHIHPEQITLLYEVTEPIGGLRNKSLPATIRVKLTLPGGTDTNPSTPWENEALAKAIVIPQGIISSPEGVSVTVAPYPNMEVGDRITLSWNGEFVKYELKSQAELGKPVVLPIAKEVIDAAGDSDMLEVRYELRDVVNNWSRWSLPTYVEVEVGNSTLPAPVAPQAANMELNLATLAGADVQALVLSYPGIHATDEITLTVERNTAEGMGLDPYVAVKPVGTSIGFVQFLIPNEQFEPIAQGRARLKYKVKKVSGDELRSKSLPLTIVGEAQVLAPPKLPVAEQNNGVLDPTAHNVIAQVPAYYFMADGNDVTLVWMGKTAGGANVIHEEVKNLNSDDVGETVAFLIPDDKVSALAGGTLELYYTVTTFARAFFKSPSLLVQVSAGGGALLPSPSVDGASADGVLDPADIVLEALVRIAPYTGMAPLDKVTLHWEGRAPEGVYSASTTLNSGTSGKDVIFRVKKQYVDANLNGSVAVWYEVVRGNRTFISETLPLTIGATVVTPLPDPTVKEAEDGTLDPANTVNGATVIIDASAHLKVGDVVAIAWEGPGSSDNKEKTITAQQAGKQVSVIFSGALVAANVGNKVSISYAVKRATGADQRSEKLELLVTGGLSSLEKPAVAGVDASGVMIPETVPATGVAVTVPSYTGMAVEDSIVVKWAGGPSHTTAPQVVGVVGEIGFTVPKSVAVGSAGSSVGVTYEVTRNSAAPVVSATTAFNVQALLPALIVDTSNLVLNARHLRASATPAHPPAGAFAQRPAAGGVAPYRYESSAPKIAEVDATGRVVSVGNGNATITVTDDAGQSVSYGVKTSNVLTFVLFSFHTYTESAKAISNGGAHVPSLADWVALRANYGGNPGLTYTGGGRDHRCWAADASGFGKRWAIFPQDGRTVLLKDVGFGGDAANAFGMKG